MTLGDSPDTTATPAIASIEAQPEPVVSELSLVSDTHARPARSNPLAKSPPCPPQCPLLQGSHRWPHSAGRACSVSSAANIGSLLIRRAVLVCLLSAVMMLCATESALAFLEDDATWEGDPVDCPACHTDGVPLLDTLGPARRIHHDQPEVRRLSHDTYRPVRRSHAATEANPTDNCMVCHDGSGGNGVYGAIMRKDCP